MKKTILMIGGYVMLLLAVGPIVNFILSQHDKEEAYKAEVFCAQGFTSYCDKTGH